MTRECSADYKEIEKYIRNYNISSNLDNSKYTASLKLMHKCYFSVITWNSELKHRLDYFLQLYPTCNTEICNRISESVSDIGSSFFNWANGNYKASRVMLRVSIENYIRAISSMENKHQLTEKNVYHLFDIASDQKIFNSNNIPLVRRIYDSLHSDYKTLCRDAHTATNQNMENLTSLADLPAFQLDKSECTAVIHQRISKSTTALFCILFNDFFHKMHHRNQENILNSINSNYKPIIIAPQTEA